MTKTFLIFVTMTSVWLLFAFAKLPRTPITSETDGYAPLNTTPESGQDPLKASLERGLEIYTEYCIQCHLGKGEGVAKTFPPLANSNWLLPEMRTNAIRVVKYGQSGEIKVNGETYNSAMANLELYDDEVADVMNYIMNNWGNSQETMVTEEEVKGIGKG